MHRKAPARCQLWPSRQPSDVAGHQHSLGRVACPLLQLCTCLNAHHAQARKLCKQPTIPSAMGANAAACAATSSAASQILDAAPAMPLASRCGDICLEAEPSDHAGKQAFLQQSWAPEQFASRSNACEVPCTARARYVRLQAVQV